MANRTGEVRKVPANDDRRGSRSAAELASQVTYLEEEVAALRRRLAEQPRESRQLEQRIAEAQAMLANVTAQNERLAATCLASELATALAISVLPQPGGP